MALFGISMIFFAYLFLIKIKDTNSCAIRVKGIIEFIDLPLVNEQILEVEEKTQLYCLYLFIAQGNSELNEFNIGFT